MNKWKVIGEKSSQGSIITTSLIEEDRKSILEPKDSLFSRTEREEKEQDVMDKGKEIVL